MRRSVWLIDLLVLAVIFVLHEWTKRLMADGVVAATILSTGRHVPLLTMIAACAFVALRLFVMVVLPVVMITRWGLLLAGRLLGAENEDNEIVAREFDLETKPEVDLTPTVSKAPPSPWFFS